MKKIQQDYGYSQTNTGSDLKYALSFHVIDLIYLWTNFVFVCLLVFWLKSRRLSRKIFGLLFSTAPQGESNWARARTSQINNTVIIIIIIIIF